MPAVQTILIVVAVFILPLVLAQLISRAAKMPDAAWRIYVVGFALAAGLAITITRWDQIKLGIDLSGGSILVYEVAETDKDFSMSELIDAVRLRVNPDGLREVTVRPYGDRQVEVIIPRSKSQDDQASREELDRIKTVISSTGALQFRILANRNDHAAIIARAEAMQLADKDLIATASGGKREVVATWVPVDPGAMYLVTDPQLAPQFASRQLEDGTFEILLAIDPYEVTGSSIVRAAPGRDPESGGHSVDFVFDATGARRFSQLTRANLPSQDQTFFRHLGIVLDGTLKSAPRINSEIGERGQISGSFTQPEVEDLALVLKAGKLPATLEKEPSTELVTGPTLGEDTIRKGVRAMVISTVAVVIFMIMYYRFAGFVANYALLLNVLLIVAFMIVFNAAFTLSGLAGLALTVGMAVDANVLIYERMREELARGATLRMAIRNGFGRATTTIVDANVTTLISAVVLFVIGTDQIKGFATTLILGVALNLFTAIFCSRIVFDIAERMRWIKQLKMMKILDQTNFDFLGKRYIATAFSLIIIAIGLGAAFQRGKGLLDIDFTGGVSVQTVFNEPIAINDVRQAVANDPALTDVTVQDVQLTGEQEGVRYIINTSNADIDAVEKQLVAKFGDKLETNRMTIGALAMIEPPAATPEAGTAPAAPATTPGGTTPPAEGATPAATPPASTEPPKTEPAPSTETPAAPATPESSSAPPPEAAPTAPPKDGASRSGQNDAGTAFRHLAAAWGAVHASALTFVAQEPQSETPAAQPTAEQPSPPEAPKSETPPAEVKQEPEAPATDEPAKSEPAPETKAADTKSGDAEKPAESAPAPATDPAAKPPAKPSDDSFTGGTMAPLEFTTAISRSFLADLLLKAMNLPVEQSTQAVFAIDNPPGTEGDVSSKTWHVRMAMPEPEARKALEGLRTVLESQPYFPSSNQIGASVASNTQQQAVMAIAASLVLILIYVWLRFTQVMFGLAAVLAVMHDVLVTLGALAVSVWLAEIPGAHFLLIEPFKISLPVVAAFLTIIGYSLNDTIVIFDRIREVRGKSPNISADLINLCVNQTLSRTILTSLTVLIVVVILYISGGEGLHSFAFALVVGVVTGTYSTVYIATPALLWMSGSTSAKSTPATPARGIPAQSPGA